MFRAWWQKLTVPVEVNSTSKGLSNEGSNSADPEAELLSSIVFFVAGMSIIEIFVLLHIFEGLTEGLYFVLLPSFVGTLNAHILKRFFTKIGILTVLIAFVMLFVIQHSVFSGSYTKFLRIRCIGCRYLCNQLVF